MYIARYICLVLLLMLAVVPVQAQYYAAVGGSTAASCLDPSLPCTLARAVQNATSAGSGQVVYIRLPSEGAEVVFTEDLTSDTGGMLDAPVTIDTYVQTSSNPPAFREGGVSGHVTIEGDVTVGTDVTVELPEHLVIELRGGRILVMRDRAAWTGSGVLLLGSSSDEVEIFLGDPSDQSGSAEPVSAAVANLHVDTGGTAVRVVHQGADEGTLEITNRLDVRSGSLITEQNDLLVSSRRAGTDPGVFVAEGSRIEGEGIFRISVEPVADNGFGNTRADAFPITGGGVLAMRLDKTTDAGVLVALVEVGASGTSYNRAGALFLTEAAVLHGSFRAEGASRTEFDKLQTLSGDLEVFGPGGEVGPGDGLCDVDISSGDDSGVYFFRPVTVEGDLVLDDTDAPALTCRTQGVFLLVATPSGEANAFSIVKGTFSTDGTTGLTMDGGDGYYHSLALEGNLVFDEPPVFHLTEPADAFGPERGEVGDLPSSDCAEQTQAVTGNKLRFSGSQSQEVHVNGVLQVPSVEILKTESSSTVEIVPEGGTLVVERALEVLRGILVTNGRLDAGGTATVVVNRDDLGFGIVDAGSAPRAYVSDLETDIPLKVKYTGRQGVFTSDELPGPAVGSDAGTEIVLPYLEVATCTTRPIITLGKSLTLRDELRLTSGHLDLSLASLTLANGILIALGDGDLTQSSTSPTGGLILPTGDSESVHTLGSAFQPGVDGIDLLFYGRDDRVTGIYWPPAADDPHVVRNVQIAMNAGGADSPVVRLNGDCEEGHRDEHDRCVYRVNPSSADNNPATLDGGLYVVRGMLNLQGSVLEVGASDEGTNELAVYDHGELADSMSGGVEEVTGPVREALAAYRTARTEAEPGERISSSELMDRVEALHAEQVVSDVPTGLLRFVGSYRTAVWLEASAERRRHELPPVELDRGTEGRLIFYAAAAFDQGAHEPAQPHELGIPQITLVEGAPDSSIFVSATVGLLDIAGAYTQLDGTVVMEGVAADGEPEAEGRQRMFVGGDFTVERGAFVTQGAAVDVAGNFYLGRNEATRRSNALFSLTPEGQHTVLGMFRVAPDRNPDERQEDVDGDGSTDFNPDQRNRYFLGGGLLDLFGDYDFRGTGDRFDDGEVPREEQGLQGVVRFSGPVRQEVYTHHGRDGDGEIWNEDAFLNTVVVAGTGDDAGLVLFDPLVQNATGILSLEFGIIETNGDQYEHVLLNTNFEKDLTGQNSAPVGPTAGESGVVEGGTTQSFVHGTVQRVVSQETSNNGQLTGGYVFPVGTVETNAEGEDQVVFRPLILQLIDELGFDVHVRVQALHPADLPSDGVVFDQMVVEDTGGEDLLLDVLGNVFWKVEIDRTLSIDPYVRIAAAGLPNVSDPTKLRIIQWDCDGEDPRLAGFFDGADAGLVTGFVEGIPNVTHKNVVLQSCQILGIASNSAVNPIDPSTGNQAYVQWIHAASDVGSLELVVDGDSFVEELAFRAATPFLTLPAGSLHVEVRTTSGTTISEDTLVLEGGEAYTVVAGAGEGSGLELWIKEHARRVASVPGLVEFFTVHAARDIPALDVRLLDPVTHDPSATLIDDLDYGGITEYLFLEPGSHLLDLASGNHAEEFDVFHLDLTGQEGRTLVLLVSRETMESSPILVAFDADGSPVTPAVVTSVEEVELPASFSVRGNYPNPFNPSTTIAFDLPEAAEVSVEIIDVLGRRVMTVPAQRVEAGANRTLQVNASALASGVYLYRIVARGASATHVAGGRMTLLK